MADNNNENPKKSNSKKYVFNPVKEDESGKMAKRMIWSSESISLALAGIANGRKLKANPFYENNTKLLKGDLVFQRDSFEICEWKKCASDIIYFANNYCKLMTPEGIKQIVLRDYQKNYLTHLCNCKMSIYRSCRQSGKTTTSAIFMLWYILFNTDKNAMIVANKRKTSVEILTKLKNIFTELPFFLKPGIYKWNEGEIVLDNGCRVQIEATTTTAAIGNTVHVLLFDEVAWVAPNILDKFYNSIAPIVTAGKGKIILSSTVNGRNLFYRLWIGAVSGDSDYSPFETTWDEVPEWNPDTRQWEKRDEQWHKKQIANLGGEEQFNAQFGVDFQSSTNTLISKTTLRKYNKLRKIFVNKDLPGVRYSDSFFWHPDFDPMTDLKKSFLVLTGDISEGIGLDYTVFQICKVESDGKIRCVGFLRSNTIGRDEIANALTDIISKWCNAEHVLVSFEKNTYGDLFLKYITDEDNFDSSCLVRYKKDANSKGFTYGVKITSGNKTPSCQLFKEAYERGEIINDSAEFGMELDNFNDDGTGHYKASYGHDDMVMSMIQLVFVRETLQFKLMLQEAESGVGMGERESDSDLWSIGIDNRRLFNSPTVMPTVQDIDSMNIYNF